MAIIARRIIAVVLGVSAPDPDALDPYRFQNGDIYTFQDGEIYEFN